MPAGARLRYERARPWSADDNSVPAEFGEGTRDGERAYPVGLDEPARGRQALPGAEPGGLGPEPFLKSLAAAIVDYERQGYRYRPCSGTGRWRNTSFGALPRPAPGCPGAHPDVARKCLRAAVPAGRPGSSGRHRTAVRRDPPPRLARRMISAPEATLIAAAGILAGIVGTAGGITSLISY